MQINKSLLKPKYWGTWALIGFAKVLVNTLSYKALMKLAVSLGYLAKPLMKNRNEIAKINLQIAFPDKSENEIQNLVNDSYKSACMAGIESLIAWFMSEKNFNKINFDVEDTLFKELHENSNVWRETNFLKPKQSKKS